VPGGPHETRRRRLGAHALSCAAFLLLGLAAPAQAEDLSITSFDGTRIVLHWFPLDGKPAPTVLVGPGYATGGDLDPTSGSAEEFGSAGLAPLRKAGYNILTWDPRGFGKSGGVSQFNSPDFEARDVQAIIDWLATRPEARLDAPGDPQVGMHGGSYGGAIQLVTAQREPRLDAITPSITWHSLKTSLFRDNALKHHLTILCGAGEAQGWSAGIFQPRPEAGAQDPVLTRACSTSTATGTAPSAEDQAWFAARGPGALAQRIRTPTLLVHGTADTLFTLQEAIDNYAAIKPGGAPLKMLWFCGGHGTCVTGTGTPKVEKAVVAWLNRWVKRDERVDTGPAFEWVADDKRWRSADGYPLPVNGALGGRGSGTLTLEHTRASGSYSTSNPAPPEAAVEVRTDPAPAEADLVGSPRVRVTYRGIGSPMQTWLHAQLVDDERRAVIGGLVTPIPVTLDGTERTIERELEPIACTRSPAAATASSSPRRRRSTTRSARPARSTSSTRSSPCRPSMARPSRRAARRAGLPPPPRRRAAAPASARSARRGAGCASASPCGAVSRGPSPSRCAAPAAAGPCSTVAAASGSGPRAASASCASPCGSPAPRRTSARSASSARARA
jgi:ABC-2 type transport system ATP-binding protein